MLSRQGAEEGKRAMLIWYQRFPVLGAENKGTIMQGPLSWKTGGGPGYKKMVMRPGMNECCGYRDSASCGFEIREKPLRAVNVAAVISILVPGPIIIMQDARHSTPTRTT